MTLKIKKIIGANKKEIFSKKFNIFVGISLGNKWFDKDNISEYLYWALKHARDEVLVIIADDLHKVNLEVISSYSPSRASRKVKQEGEEIEREVNDIITKMDRNSTRRLQVVNWEKVCQEKEYVRLRKVIYQEFERNAFFKKYVTDIIKNHLKKIKNRKFTAEDILKLSTYVLDELPLFYHGVKYNGLDFNTHMYPNFTKINRLVEDTQKGKIFGDLYKKLGYPHSVIVELNH